MIKQFYFLAIIFITALSSCSKYSALQKKNFKKAILKQNLESKFGISNDVYSEFIDNLIFDEKGNVIGAIYDKIESQLDDNSSDQFWKNFGFKVRKSVSSNSISTRSANPVEDDHGDHRIYEGYKPKRGGCVVNSRWICVIRP